MKKLSYRSISAVSAIALGLAAPVVAQTVTPPAEVTDPDAPAAPSGTDLLNQQSVEQSSAQNAENAQNAQQYRAELTDFSRGVNDAEAARQRYEADMAAYNQRVAQQRADHEAAMARWREDVAACQRGVSSRCAQPAATPN